MVHLQNHREYKTHLKTQPCQETQESQDSRQSVDITEGVVSTNLDMQ